MVEGAEEIQDEGDRMGTGEACISWGLCGFVGMLRTLDFILRVMGSR
jgi:hypothetical protein